MLYFAYPSDYVQDLVNDMATTYTAFRAWERDLTAAACYDTEWLMEICLTLQDADALAKALINTFDMCATYPYWAKRAQLDRRAEGQSRAANMRIIRKPLAA
jgi:hypothetical protein